MCNAVVAFSSYLSSAQDHNGEIEFLHYYDRCVLLLLDVLKRNEAHDIPTLLTILQLATIEVSLKVTGF